MTGITISIGFFHFIRRLIFDRGVARGLIFDRGVARIVVVGHIFFHYSLYFFISNSVYCDFYLKLLTLLEHSSSLLHFDEVSEHLRSGTSCIVMRFRSTWVPSCILTRYESFISSFLCLFTLIFVTVTA